MNNDANLLWHGTGARRRQSIEKGGLRTRDGLLFASPLQNIAKIFAVARGQAEDDYGLLIGFQQKGVWFADTRFPGSVCTREDVPRTLIRKLKIVKPDEELQAFEELKWIAGKLHIKLRHDLLT